MLRDCWTWSYDQKAWLPINLKEKGKKEKVKSEKTDKKRKHNGRTWQSAD